ncbi:MAG TPA: nitrite/sulfite reductase, partial [Burkholderiaceae bacterium]
QGNDTAIGKIIGPSFSAPQMPEVIARLLHVYVRERIEGERFVDTVQRLGLAPFKDYLYATPIVASAVTGEDEYV